MAVASSRFRWSPLSRVDAFGMVWPPLTGEITLESLAWSCSHRGQSYCANLMLNLCSILRISVQHKSFARKCAAAWVTFTNLFANECGNDNNDFVFFLSFRRVNVFMISCAWGTCLCSKLVWLAWARCCMCRVTDIGRCLRRLSLLHEIWYVCIEVEAHAMNR